MKKTKNQTEELTMVKLPDGRIVNSNTSITHLKDVETDTKIQEKNSLD